MPVNSTQHCADTVELRRLHFHTPGQSPHISVIIIIFIIVVVVRDADSLFFVGLRLQGGKFRIPDSSALGWQKDCQHF